MPEEPVDARLVDARLVDARLVDALRAAGCVFAEEEAAVLRSAASEGGDLEAMLARRVAGEPLEQVVGWAEFCGLRIPVAPGVFVPRRRSALVVEVAAAELHAGAVVVDLCCGTGAIGVAMAQRSPDLELHAGDLDPVAVACARLAVQRHCPAGQVHEGDLYDALPRSLLGRVDVIAVNAPYVPSAEIELLPPEARLHEHRVALDGGADGAVLHRRVAEGAGAWLAPGGRLVVETSAALVEATLAACGDAGLAAAVTWGEDLPDVPRLEGACVVRAGSEPPTAPIRPVEAGLAE